MRKLAATLLLSLATSGLAALAETDLQAGIRLFNAGKYDEAQPFFLKASANADPNATYYLALNYQRGGDVGRAAMQYQYLSQNFANTQAGQYAKSALAAIGPGPWTFKPLRAQPYVPKNNAVAAPAKTKS